MFKGLDASVKNYLVSVPLMADLRSPAMRDRHWTALMEATGVRFGRGRVVTVAGVAGVCSHACDFG